MPTIERPICEYGGVGGCDRPAIYVVCLQGSRRWRLSCDFHRDRWKNSYWVAKLLGWRPAPEGWQED